MIIILTQCFPSRVGGIETLMYDIALNLSHKYDVMVLADQQDSTKDLEFDKNNKNFSILRFKGLKFLRKKIKFNQLKNICSSNNIEAVITDSWKSLELPINFLKEKKIPIISLVHGNEIIIKNASCTYTYDATAESFLNKADLMFRSWFTNKTMIKLIILFTCPF